MELQHTPDILFESSWEICNKVGGIYTVITSKIPVLKNLVSEYCSIGPLFDSLPEEFTSQQPSSELQSIFDMLSHEGIRCVYGVWDVVGTPCILIDGRSLFVHANDIKKFLWEQYGVDSLHSAYDFNEPLVWSWAVGKFIDLYQKQAPDKTVLGHFHEWLAAFSVFYLDSVSSSVSTVFTTHATMLGRTLCSHGKLDYDNFSVDNPEALAREYGVVDKFSTERAGAKFADGFSTVSDITAKECEVFFGVHPHVTPNGLPINLYPSFEEMSVQHLKYQEKIHEYLLAHFFPYQSFDLNDTLCFFYGGRYEFLNKGVDIMVDALAQLNDHLKVINSSKTVVMFFLVAVPGTRPKEQLVTERKNVERIIDSVHEKNDFFMQRLILDVLLGEEQTTPVYPPGFVEHLRKIFQVSSSQNPPLCTHEIDELNDPTLHRLHERGLVNNPDDKVKIVFMPAYLDGNDGLVDIPYEEFISGCHLGVFPSFYEPWGYTPLESVALAVPAVTTFTAGFGKHISEKTSQNHPGLYVLKRSLSYPSTTQDLFAVFKEFVSLSSKQRSTLRLQAQQLSELADWNVLIKEYQTLYAKVLSKK